MKIAILIAGENHTDGITPAMLNYQLSQLAHISPHSVIFCIEEQEEWTLDRVNHENNNIAKIVKDLLLNMPELLQFHQLSPSGIHAYFPLSQKEHIKQTLINSGKIANVQSLNFLVDCLLTYNMRAEKSKLLDTLHQHNIPFLCIDNAASRHVLTQAPSLENIIKEERRRIDTMVDNIIMKAIPQLKSQQGGTIIAYVGHGHVKNLAASLAVKTKDYPELNISINAMTLAFPSDITSSLACDLPMKLKHSADFNISYDQINHKIFFCTRDSSKYDFKKVIEFFKQTFSFHKPLSDFS